MRSFQHDDRSLTIRALTFLGSKPRGRPHFRAVETGSETQWGSPRPRVGPPNLCIPVIRASQGLRALAPDVGQLWPQGQEDDGTGGSGLGLTPD